MKKINRFVGLVAVLGVLVFNAQVVNAGTLTTPRDYLNRQKASQTTGIQHEVFFTTATAVSGGAGVNKVIIEFPDADDGLWCRTAGSITATGIANPTGATETASALPGTLSGSCTQGAGASSFDTITVTGVDNLTSATKYGVRISGNAGALGTSGAANSIKVTLKTNNGTSDVDTATYALSIIADDQVVVTATVDPTLTVSLSGNSANLGTLSSTSVNYIGVTSTVSTNAASGYISLVKYDNVLTDGSHPFVDVTGGTVDPGTAEYGVSTSDTAVDVTTSTVSPSCSTSQQSQGSAGNASALTTTFQSFASAASGVSSDGTTLCFLASTSATQAPGTYTSTATLVTTAKF